MKLTIERDTVFRNMDIATNGWLVVSVEDSTIVRSGDTTICEILTTFEKIKWDPVARGTFYGQNEDGLYSIHIKSGKCRQIELVPECFDFDVFPDGCRLVLSTDQD